MTAERLAGTRTPSRTGARVGRPRGFDPDRMLLRIADLFDRYGYEGLSVADLALELGVSHPSLYAAFGPKTAVYRKALDAYAVRWTVEAQERLSHPDLTSALSGFMTRQAGAGGCMLSAALQTSAPDHVVEARHARALRTAMIRTVRMRLDQAVRDGDLARDADVGAMATALCGMVHGLSVLARDGVSDGILAGFCKAAVAGVLSGATATDAHVRVA